MQISRENEDRQAARLTSTRLSGQSEGEAIGNAQPIGQTAYRVYKRRWFGLLQLVLLNIMISWNVRYIAEIYHACSSANRV